MMGMPQSIQSINQIGLFKELPRKDLAKIEAVLKEKSFQKGELVFLEGRTCERVYFVKEGRVKVFRMDFSGREQILQILEPGDTCACHPSTGPFRCSASSQALTNVSVWYFTVSDYTELLEKNPALNRRLASLLAERLKCFSSLIEEVSLKDVRKRLVKFLIDQARTNQNGSDSCTVLLPFTREEMAQRLGAARETISRQLAELCEEKYIDLRPRQIIIHRLSDLKQLL